jgi:hypothetical protein
MKPRIAGLHGESHNSESGLEGVSLVRVDQVFYHCKCTVKKSVSVPHKGLDARRRVNIHGQRRSRLKIILRRNLQSAHHRPQFQKRTGPRCQVKTLARHDADHSPS